MTRLLTLSLLLAATALGACGRMGDLEKPTPLASRTDATVSGQNRSDNGDPTQGPEGAVNRQSDRNREIDPAPPRTLPIQGMGSDPSAVAPQGALPDPYSNPQ